MAIRVAVSVAAAWTETAAAVAAETTSAVTATDRRDSRDCHPQADHHDRTAIPKTITTEPVQSLAIGGDSVRVSGTGKCRHENPLSDTVGDGRAAQLKRLLLQQG